jgi:transcriptional regulator with XRE-family HTH domain
MSIGCPPPARKRKKIPEKEEKNGCPLCCLQIVSSYFQKVVFNEVSSIMCVEAMHMIIDLSTRLRQLRTDKRLRQNQVARLVGVSKGAISAYETDIRLPSYDVLIRLANLYRVSTDYLLGRTDDRTLDISGLSTREVAIISELVASMTAKNQKMEE